MQPANVDDRTGVHRNRAAGGSHAADSNGRMDGRRGPGRRTLRLALAMVVAGMAPMLAACSSSSSSSATTRPPAATQAPTTSSSAPTTTTSGVAAVPGPTTGPAPIYEVSTGTVPGLGTVLVAGNGFTLYMFAPDKRSGVSTCYNACATAWPPLLLTGTGAPVYGSGVNPHLLGTTRRTDGTVQVTYDGWPLYLWVSDSQPGQATGQGINNNGGLWYVLNPAGQVVTRTAS